MIPILNKDKYSGAKNSNECFQILFYVFMKFHISMFLRQTVTHIRLCDNCIVRSIVMKNRITSSS